MIDRAIDEGEVERVSACRGESAPASARRQVGARQGPPGVFFATRTPPMADAEEGYRYWRYVELGSGRRWCGGDLEILRRIDPEGGEPAEPEGVDLDAAWEAAADSIVAEHNERADLRARQEQIGPAPALGARPPSRSTVSPSRSEPTSSTRADAALSVERSSAVRRALREVQDRLDASEISRDTAAAEIVRLVDDFGLRPVAPSAPAGEDRRRRPGSRLLDGGACRRMGEITGT